LPARPVLDQSLALAKKYLIDAEHAGWFSSYDPKATTQRTNKGSVWQVGCHVREALRLVGATR
jgi:hypothetical protein